MWGKKHKWRMVLAFGGCGAIALLAPWADAWRAAGRGRQRRIHICTSEHKRGGLGAGMGKWCGGGRGRSFGYTCALVREQAHNAPFFVWRCFVWACVMDKSAVNPLAPLEALDLDTLLLRLRAVAAQHESTTGVAAPVARPWLGAGGPPSTGAGQTGAAAAVAPALPWALAARAGGLGPFLLADDVGFVALAYRQLLARAPDAGGQAHLLERLRQHTPRTELLAELALSAEAQALRGGQALAWGWLAKLALGAVHAPLPRGPWLVRGVWRRTERWLTRRTQRGPLGLAWQVASTQDAQYAAVQAQLQQLQQLQQEWAQQKELAAQAQASATAVDDFLAALEVSFRGPVEALRAQLAQDYLGYVQEARTALGVDGPCLDLGCGRGVWLEVLREHGLQGQGVDLNAAAAHEAQALGLDVQVGDALAWLQARPDASALVVSAFHLMEHLPFALRLALVKECARVLMPGGLLIMETPNPENIWVATHTFHHDPTHSEPLTPDSLAFLAHYCGLEVVAVPRLHPYPAEAALAGDTPVVQRLNHMTCGGQDFAVIARKI